MSIQSVVLHHSPVRESSVINILVRRLGNADATFRVPKLSNLSTKLKGTQALYPPHRLCKQEVSVVDNPAEDSIPSYVIGTTFRRRISPSSRHHVNRKSFVSCSLPVRTSTTFALTPTCCGQTLRNPTIASARETYYKCGVLRVVRRV